MANLQVRRDLGELRAIALAEIDRKAEEVRQTEITPGDGQMLVYEDKRNEALAIDANRAIVATLSASDYPLLQVDMSIDSLTLEGAADQVLARYGLKRRIAMTVNHFSAVADLIAESDLISVVPHTTLEKAIFREESYREIVTINKSVVDPLDPVGLSFEELNSKQQDALIKIIDLYLSALPNKLNQERRKVIQDEGFDHIHFGWVGAKELGSAHYYRVQGLSFLIEFDNSQNGANHVHTVWRDFEGDFGRDILVEHYLNSPHHVVQ